MKTRFKSFLAAVMAAVSLVAAVVGRARPVAVAFSASVGRAIDAALFGYMANRGMILGASPIAPSESYAYKFSVGRTVNSGSSEVIRQRYYDSVLYPAAGAQNLSFFSLPMGQGVTSSPGAAVGTTKTKFDTNMENANMLPSGKSFLIESIELIFWPGSVSTANTYTAAPIGNFSAVAAVATLMALNDVQAFYQAGLISLDILAKNYLQELTMAFPPKTGLDGIAAIGTNSATTGSSIVQYGRNQGRAYYVDPMLTLQPAVNFSLQLQYPAAVAMPSGFIGRVTCVLDGLLSRASQ